MSTDDTAEEPIERADGAERGSDEREGGERGGDDLGDGGTARAVEELDQGLVDLLAWVLDTETRARIYIYLRAHPDSTSREVADGTGLYPSTVREALAELNADGTVTRQKRQSSGAGNNPYEYDAIAPSDLVVDVVGRVEEELNTVYTLDARLAGRESDAEPITITVDRPGTDAEDDATEHVTRADGDITADDGDVTVNDGTDRVSAEDDAGAVGADDD